MMIKLLKIDLGWLGKKNKLFIKVAEKCAILIW